MIVDREDVHKRGRVMKNLPYHMLTCAELADVYAFYLSCFGYSNARTNLVRDELDSRQEKVDRKR